MPKYLIIGGVAGGASTAARLRRLDEQAQIIMFERGDYISYANCGLPYYIGGVIEDRDRLFLQTPESFNATLNVDVRVQQEVTSINREAKEVTVTRRDGSTYSESYDKLILAPGAEPLIPPIKGIDDELIFTLRNVHDTDRIKNYVDQHDISHVTVVGAGFIGLEMAENMHHLGIKVTIVEMADQVMVPLDFEMAAPVHQHLKSKNVELYLSDGVKSFARDSNKLKVTLSSGRSLTTDMAILSIGVRPDSKLAATSGLELGINRGIKVNEYLQTSDPDIYALGDAVVFTNPITGEEANTYLAGPANKQGRLLADNLVNGHVRKYKGSIGTAVAKVFDLTVATTGANEKTLRKLGIPYEASIIHPASHADYYPGASPLSLKIIFDPQNGKLLGAQAVGYDGVEKRIDVIASIISRGGDIWDMQAFEQAYAPPFSSAKDPVNMAALVAENIINGLVKVIHWHQIPDLDLNETMIIDARTPEEYQLGHIPGSVNIPLQQIRKRLDEIPKDKKIVVNCKTGGRSYMTARILMQNGFKAVYNLSGGYTTYKAVTQKQSNEDIFGDDQLKSDAKTTPASTPTPTTGVTIEADACGLQCPGPIMKLKTEMDKLKDGDILRISASDPGFATDAPSWSNVTSNKLLSLETKGNKIIATIQKGAGTLPEKSGVTNDDKTFVVFSNDLDRVLAAFVIANGAAALGKKVTMFFTFWGLSVIKKPNAPKVEKDMMANMFGMMLPKSSLGLGLSKINFAGIGPKMMRQRMKDKNVDSIETMIKQAIKAGVKLIACQMSMDVMGVKAEELIDGVTIGGVATYLEAAEKSNVNLFI
ncbi:MAG TPA: FAD-dependent oxidoreductase [Candidatus Cloacimonadota bacterium]|nr:FAD-dependent oxidoreductase [Candidatus Cloacimonadota bacterium]